MWRHRESRKVLTSGVHVLAGVESQKSGPQDLVPMTGLLEHITPSARLGSGLQGAVLDLCLTLQSIAELCGKRSRSITHSTWQHPQPEDGSCRGS